MNNTKFITSFEKQMKSIHEDLVTVSGTYMNKLLNTALNMELKIYGKCNNSNLITHVISAQIKKEMTEQQINHPQRTNFILLTSSLNDWLKSFYVYDNMLKLKENVYDKN